eukprot:g1485.t1
MLLSTIGVGRSQFGTRLELRNSFTGTLRKPKSDQNSVVTMQPLRRSTRVASSVSVATGTPTTAQGKSVPKRIAILVEPSPFTYVSGYKNRFCNTIKYLVEAGCEVLVVTTGRGVTFFGADTSAMRDAPENYYGAEVIGSYSLGFPFYPNLPLTLGLSPRIYNKLAGFKPDIIHCSTPGFLCFSAWLYSKLLNVPLAFSYHTHVPKYAPKYKLSFLVPLLWTLIRLLHTAAHITLLTSTLMLNEFDQEKAAPKESMQVWKKGVDTDQFNPKFKTDSMRLRLTDGNPTDPVMVYVGRLGTEKNLKFLKGILTRSPKLRLAFVGDGPAREELIQYFAGTKTTFLGMLHGDELSSAYASADVFVMPSETETLGFVVMEAMASQIPVVAVEAGGIPDIISTGNQGGFLYKPGDVDQATNLVNDLIQNEKFRREMGIAAKKQVERWDWRAATRYLLEVQYPLAIARFKKEQELKTEDAAIDGALPSPT